MFTRLLLAVMIALATPGVIDCYSIFRGPDQRDSRFEPSAVVWDAAASRYIVFDDKDDEPPVYSYGQEPDTGVLCGPERVPLEDGNGASVEVKKFEGATASLSREGVFYALTACDRDKPAYNKLLRIDAAGDGSLAFSALGWFPKAVDGIKEAEGCGYLKIEALAAPPEGEFILAGIRETGPDFRNTVKAVQVWKLDLSGAAAPVKTFSLDVKELVGREEGISGLEYDRATGRYLMLTSYEADGEGDTEVGGRLWSVERAAIEGDSPCGQDSVAQIASFSHKPEGVTTGPDGVILVVFDDDSRRKPRFFAGTEYADTQNRAFYTVLDR